MRNRWRRLSQVKADVNRLFPETVERASAWSSLATPPGIPGYSNVEFVGRGGMGVVYKARHATLDRWVAMKMLLPGLLDGAREVEALMAEASAVAALQHPGIVQAFDWDEATDGPLPTLDGE